MATRAQVSFLRENRDRLHGPALIVGSRMYDYDEADLRDGLADAGVHDIVGIDIDDGPGVDEVVDIYDADAFVAARRNSFATVLCMEILTHVHQPFTLAETVTKLLRPGGTMILSECAVRKISRMPGDNWRFTYAGLQLLFGDLEFDDDRVRMSLPRDHRGRLLPYDGHLPEVIMDIRHPDESNLGFLVRRIHRRYLAGGVFAITRLMPEVSIAALATKPA